MCCSDAAPPRPPQPLAAAYARLVADRPDRVDGRPGAAAGGKRPRTGSQAAATAEEGGRGSAKKPKKKSGKTDGPNYKNEKGRRADNKKQ